MNNRIPDVKPNRLRLNQSCVFGAEDGFQPRMSVEFMQNVVARSVGIKTATLGTVRISFGSHAADLGAYLKATAASRYRRVINRREGVGNGGTPFALTEDHGSDSRQIQTRTRSSSAVVRCANTPRLSDCRPDRPRSRDCLRPIEFSRRPSNGLD